MITFSDGNGNESNGFKCEWATVKDNELYVGGLGKEWTTPTGEVINFNPMYVKKVSPNGQVRLVCSPVSSLRQKRLPVLFLGLYSFLNIAAIKMKGERKGTDRQKYLKMRNHFQKFR